MDHFKYEYLNKVGTMEQLEYDSKINYSRSFAKSYGKVMAILCLIFIGKRLLFEPWTELGRVLFPLQIIVIFGVIIYFQTLSNLTTRLTPFCIVLLSYYGHTSFLFVQHSNYNEVCSMNSNRGDFHLSIDTIIK
jgi:DNA modification methylase